MASCALDLSCFSHLPLTSAELLHRLACQRDLTAARLARFMGYYRNPMTELADYLPYPHSATLGVRPYRQYQEIGLPSRITGFRHTAQGCPVATGSLDVERKEVVIENDIGWRINALVDFALPRLPAISSTAGAPELRQTITHLLNSVLEASGGVTLLQQLTLLGSIHGTSYFMLQPSPELLQALASPSAPATASIQNIPNTCPDTGESLAAGGLESPDVNSAAGDPLAAAGTPGTARPDIASSPPAANASQLLAWARALRLVTVDAARVLPLTSPEASPSCPLLAHAAILHPAQSNHAPPTRDPSMLEKVTRWITGRSAATAAPTDLSFDLWGDGHWQRYVAGRLADQGTNPLLFVPLIPFVNQIAPGTGSQSLPEQGLSDVEPLIGLQDELNTRLSDRANRVTLQSFRMYLARGVEDFITRPVGPGQMWATDNPQASIESFGGDAASPSEDTHINEIREALDKISGVPPVAAGLLRARLGNLTSAVALRITLIALLARTEKRRAALTQTLALLARRILEIFDAAGILRTAPADRLIDVNWPNAIPENDLEKLQEAKLKLALGLPRNVVLAELGYDELP